MKSAEAIYFLGGQNEYARDKNQIALPKSPEGNTAWR
jgi:hypothetical protein